MPALPCGCWTGPWFAVVPPLQCSKHAAGWNDPIETDDEHRERLRRRFEREVVRGERAPQVPTLNIQENVTWFKELADRVVNERWNWFCNQWLIISLCASPLEDVLTQSQRQEKT